MKQDETVLSVPSAPFFVYFYHLFHWCTVLVGTAAAFGSHGVFRHVSSIRHFIRGILGAISAFDCCLIFISSLSKPNSLKTNQLSNRDIKRPSKMLKENHPIT